MALPGRIFMNCQFARYVKLSQTPYVIVPIFARERYRWRFLMTGLKLLLRECWIRI